MKVEGDSRRDHLLNHWAWSFHPPQADARAKDLREGPIRHNIALVIWVLPEGEKCTFSTVSYTPKGDFPRGSPKSNSH